MTINPLDSHDPVSDISLKEAVEYILQWINDHPVVTVRKNGSDVGTRPALNFIEGTNITLTVVEDAGAGEIDITIASTGGGTSFAQTFGDGVAVSFTITHNLGTRDVQVTIYETASPFGEVVPTVRHTTINTTTLLFLLPPTVNQYRVVVST